MGNCSPEFAFFGIHNPLCHPVLHRSDKEAVKALMKSLLDTMIYKVLQTVTFSWPDTGTCQKNNYSSINFNFEGIVTVLKL